MLVLMLMAVVVIMVRRKITPRTGASVEFWREDGVEAEGRGEQAEKGGEGEQQGGGG